MAKTETDRERVERIREWFDAPVEDFADVADDFHAVVDGFRDILKAAGVDDVAEVVAMLEALPSHTDLFEDEEHALMIPTEAAAQAAGDDDAGRGATTA